MTGRVRAGAAGFLLLLGVGSACRFERRPDLVEDLVSPTAYAPPDPSVTPLEDSVRSSVIALTEALAAGDDARVVELTTPDAILIEQANATFTLASTR